MQLTSFPFDVLYHSVNDAAHTAEQNILEEAMEIHNKATRRKIEALYAHRDDSYNGNIDEDFPFCTPDEQYVEDQVKKAKYKAIINFADKYNLLGNAYWLIPQYIEYISKIPLTKNDGIINSEMYYQEFGKDAFHKGLYTLGVCKFTEQYSSDYNALVPLLLMPHKKLKNVNYSSWSLDSLHKIVDPKLYEAMTCKTDVSMYTKADLVIMREDPKPVPNMPWLAQVMLFQLKYAHPAKRNKLMVLDFNNWDNIPDPLVDIDEPKITDQKHTCKEWV